ncbi:MAG: 50S ribosomal protein L11 methyltransferase [Desulfuromonadales bacterium]|nr:50S ribosomal protein L11 methyltransferase [Desulfuromonadales bacterium]
MENEWIVIEIVVVGKLVDLAVAILSDCGSSGTIVEERKLDTFIVPDEELDPTANYTLQAYFDAGVDADQIIAEVESIFASMPIFSDQEFQINAANSVRTEDWAEGWKQNFSSFQVGNHLVIRPSWEVYAPRPGEVVIEIDPGMAFGTGTHGTTKLCLELVAELLSGDEPPIQMLDVGTGSGILALGAAALGCPAIVATDIDPVACAVAQDNFVKNNYAQQIEINTKPLEELPGRFDLIVANIMAEENIRLRHGFIEHLLPGGWLVLSGILKEKEQLVVAGFSDLPLTLFPSRYQDDWVCLLFRRTQ